MRNAFVNRQLEHLGVDQDQPHLGRRRLVDQGEQHRVDPHGLARAGGAGDQQVRHALQVGDHWIAADVLAERERQRGRNARVHLGAQDFRQAHDLARGIGDLEAHQALARNGLDDADAHHGQRAGKVLHEVDDLGPLHADSGLDLEARDDRAGIGRDHFDLHPEIEELLLDQARSELEGLGAEHLEILLRLVEQVERRQERIRQVLEQGHLLFPLDAGRFGNLDRRRLDPYRLVDFEPFLADFHDLVALDHGLLAGAAVLALLPLAQEEKVCGLHPAAQALDHGEPGHAGEETQAGREHHEEDERCAGKSQRLRQRAANQIAQHSARRLGQRGLQAVEAYRLEAAASGEHDCEPDGDDGAGPAVPQCHAFDTAETPPHHGDAKHEPPVRGDPEEQQQYIRSPRPDAAACIANGPVIGQAVTPSRVGPVIGEKRKRDVENQAEQGEPPEFADQGGELGWQRIPGGTRGILFAQ